MSIRWILLLGTASVLIGLSHVLLYRRLVRDTTRSPVLRRVGAGVLALLAAALLGSRWLYGRLPDSVSGEFAVGAWLWLGLALYLSMFLVGVGLVGFVARRARRTSPAQVDEARRLFLGRAVAGSAAAVSAAAVGLGYWRAYQPARIIELAPRIPNLPRPLDGLTIVHLTDVHIGSVLERRFLEDVVQRCNALRPDLVAITGDLVDGPVASLGPAVAALSGLKSRFGTFFVTGNHEYYSGVRSWTRALPGMGVTVLRNRWLRVGDSGASIDLVGVDDWNERRAYDLERATADRDPDRAAVLLAHQPREFEKAVGKGIGLQLSGHTHGGQFFPFTAVIPMVWTYSAGHYTHGAAHLYVSRGTGFWGPPLRLGSPPEIVKVTLLA